MADVIRAFKTDVFPLDGNLSEEVLELSTGEGVYLNPEYADEIYSSVEEALAACTGMPYESTSLREAWAGRPYPSEA
jgi:hypothetical protein